MEPYERLRLAREHAGFVGPKEASDRFGWNEHTYKSHENGIRGMKLSAAQRYAKAYGVSAAWLLTGEGGGLKEDRIEPGQKSNISSAPPMGPQVPVLSWVRAGAFAEALDVLTPSQSQEWITPTVRVGPRAFALRVNGDSMEPDFPANIIIIADPDMDPISGDFVVVQNGNNEATFKQLTRDGADWYLKPLNDRYPIKPLGESRVIAVVRQATRTLR